MQTFKPTVNQNKSLIKHIKVVNCEQLNALRTEKTNYILIHWCVCFLKIISQNMNQKYKKIIYDKRLQKLFVLITFEIYFF